MELALQLFYSKRKSKQDQQRGEEEGLEIADLKRMLEGILIGRGKDRTTPTTTTTIISDASIKELFSQMDSNKDGKVDKGTYK